MRTLHKPTLRALSVLELVSSSEHKYTLSEISRTLNIPISTLSPILYTLREQKYLGFDEEAQSYYLGMRLFEIGSRIQGSSTYQKIINIMSDVVDACGETCHFGILDRGDVLYLAKVDAKQPIRLFSTIGKRLPAYGTAIGKALLKGYSLEDLKQLYPEGLKPLTTNTITDFQKLYDQIHGNDILLYENEESNESIRCIAVPIYRNGTVVAACSVAVPIYRYSREKQSDIETALKTALVQLEQMIHLFVF